MLSGRLPAGAAAGLPAGWVVLSGILEEELEALSAEAEALGLEPVSADADGAWRSLLLRRS